MLNSLQNTKAYLEGELSQLRKQYRAPRDIFLEQQAIIQRKINIATSLPHQLPIETLIHIFLYSVSPPPRPSPLDRLTEVVQRRELAEIFFSVTLAAVCSHWRSVALSSPLLWTHFEFPYTLWHRKHVPYYLLSLYLHNSKHLSIHLSLSFSPQADLRANALFHPSMDRALISNLTRIHTLSLDDPPPRWFKHLENLLFIVDLSINWSINTEKERLQLHHCHMLSRLSLFDTFTEDNKRILYQVPTSLTILNLSSIPIDICIKTMFQCHNLIEAYIHNPLLEQDRCLQIQRTAAERVWFSEPVVFNHLAVLEWPRDDMSMRYGLWSDTFLRQVRTPQLRSLKLTSHSVNSILAQSGPHNGITYFIDQLPQTLKMLQIEAAEQLQVDRLGRLFNFQSSVERFIISACKLSVLPDISQALLGTKGRSGPGYLPQLKSLLIKDFFSEEDKNIEELKFSDLEPLVKSLEHRLGQGDSFELGFSGFGVDWAPGLQARLRGLLKKGVCLKVTEDGEKAAWLSQPI